MSFSGFSFPNTGQNPQQNTGTQGSSGSSFGPFATGQGGGNNTTSAGSGLFGGGTGTTTGTSNAPPSLFGGGPMTGTMGGNAPSGSLFGMRPATGSGLFGNLGSTGTTLVGTPGGTTANANMPTAAPTTASGFFGTNPTRARYSSCSCAICSPMIILPSSLYYTFCSRDNI